MKITESKYHGVFFAAGTDRTQPATINLAPGFSVYGEKLLKHNNQELRLWDPYRSKIGAAIMKHISMLPIKTGDKVLYLGAANGTTASHVSDIVGKEGKVFCIDIAPRVMRDLIYVCEHKTNMVPIMADAGKPEEYEFAVEQVDFLFEDVASPDQAEILIKNAEKFLKKGGYAMIAVKSRSIDVTRAPRQIYAEVESKLKKHFEVIDAKELEPFEKDHIVFLLKRKI